MPFDAGSFDVVYTSNVLEHIPMAALPGLHREVRRVLQPGGTALHVTPSHTWRAWTTATSLPDGVVQMAALLRAPRGEWYSRCRGIGATVLPRRHGERGSLRIGVLALSPPLVAAAPRVEWHDRDKGPPNRSLLHREHAVWTGSTNAPSEYARALARKFGLHLRVPLQMKLVAGAMAPLDVRRQRPTPRSLDCPGIGVTRSSRSQTSRVRASSGLYRARFSRLGDAPGLATQASNPTR